MDIAQQKLIEQLQKKLGVSEDTEHLIDWLLDVWATLAMLRERFDEARAIQLYTALAPLPQMSKWEIALV